MKVTNKASFDIVVFCWVKSIGCGSDVYIAPGQTSEVNGPYLNGNPSCYVAFEGSVICREDFVDRVDNIQIQLDIPTYRYFNQRHGLVVRYPSEKVTSYVLDWLKDLTKIDI